MQDVQRRYVGSSKYLSLMVNTIVAKQIYRMPNYVIDTKEYYLFISLITFM